nr:hypothetical protein GCM10010200_045660 [Actinomadura rugatobispora]
MAEPGFWSAYLFEDDAPDFEEEEPCRAEFDVGDGHALVLDVDLAYGAFELAVAVPGTAEPIQVGWDDQAHFHPHVMRWSELDLLARAAALRDAELRHPGPFLALLARFAVLDEQDDPDAMAPLVDGAFHLVRPGTVSGLRPETREWYELRDLRGTGLLWTTRPDGHPAVDQPLDISIERPLYSLRAPDSDDFPFAAWAALLDRARHALAAVAADPALQDAAVRSALQRCSTARGHHDLVPLARALRTAGFAQPVLLRALEDPVSRAESCWAIEALAGLDQGSLVKRWFGRSLLATARFWELTLTLAVEGRPQAHARTVAADLSDALKQAGLGRAEIGGGTFRQAPGGGSVAEKVMIEVTVRDDLDRGASLVHETLRRHDATDTATLARSGPPYDPVPLDR